MKPLREQMSQITVYALWSTDPQRQGVRYIGETSTSLGKRLQRHKSDANKVAAGKKKGSHLFHWIMQQTKEGHEICITPLVTDATQGNTEIELIARYRQEGFHLVNSSNGGDGAIGIPKTAEHKRKISEANKGKPSPHTALRNKARKGLPGHAISDEAKRKISEANKGRKKPKLADQNKLRVWTPEMREKLRSKRTGQSLSEETKRLISEKGKGRPWSEKQRAAYELRKKDRNREKK